MCLILLKYIFSPPNFFFEWKEIYIDKWQFTIAPINKIDEPPKGFTTTKLAHVYKRLEKLFSVCLAIALICATMLLTLKF